ncbi:MAG: hypothetical protein GY859_20810, partial [Desulfobacterales bacterium]|nr:hypothetical protein [Desulfobacterales bacterium]
MMKKPMWIFPLLVSMCMLISGCALRQMETMEMGDMTAPGNKMLIATQSTQFKKAVVSRITDAL